MDLYHFQATLLVVIVRYVGASPIYKWHAFRRMTASELTNVQWSTSTKLAVMVAFCESNVSQPPDK